MRTPLPLLLLSAGFILAAAPCQAQDAGHHHHRANAVEVATVDYAIEAPEVLPSGWNTLRFKNDGEEPHFVFLMRLPEGKTMDHYLTEVTTHFDGVWKGIRSGEIGQEEIMPALMGGIPEWFFQVQYMGGPGFSSPGVSSDVTVHLQPGNYVLECYMKTADGEFHAMEGMIRPLVVTEEASAAAPPEPTVRVTVSNAGMDVSGDLSAGWHVVAVHYAEHPEMGFPHDLNVARLADDASVEDVVYWMNWMHDGGLAPPAPARFVGGARPGPVGSTSYFTLDLEPGRYLFISEGAGMTGVLKEFHVH